MRYNGAILFMPTRKELTAMTATAATLPALTSDYPIAPEQTSAYQRDGHIALRGVAAPDEIAVYGPVIIEAAQRHNNETRPMEERDTYGKAFLQIMNLWTKDDAVRRFTLARRFAKIAADLMGVDGVRLYHDQALFKEPGGGPTPWHQDQGYWPLDTDNTITMWMPLVDVSERVGTMSFASASHKLGYLGDLPISDKSEAEFQKILKDRELDVMTHGAMAAGDASFHAGWTLHGAPGNPEDSVRAVMTIIYYADGTRVSGPKNVFQEADRTSWLMGAKPGEVAQSDLNPLVYAR